MEIANSRLFGQSTAGVENDVRAPLLRQYRRGHLVELSFAGPGVWPLAARSCWSGSGATAP